MHLTPSQLRELSRQQAAGQPLRVPAGAPRKKRDNREHRIQVGIVTWFRGSARSFGVDPRLLFAIPNGALYGVGLERVIRAKMLKAEGLQPGVPDLMLAVPSGPRWSWPTPAHVAVGYRAGLFIETKSPEGRLRPEQEALHPLLRERGYEVGVVRSVDEGIAAITSYLK